MSKKKLFELFTPHSEYGIPEVDWSTAKEVDFLDLEEAPLELVIKFNGLTPCSKYVAQLVEHSGVRKVKLWKDFTAQCVIAPIEAIISCDIYDNFPFTIERSVMRIGTNYFLPTLNYQRTKEFVKVFASQRMPTCELYTKILIVEKLNSV